MWFLTLYILIGVGVAVAVYVADESGGGGLWFRLTTALPFWSLYIPELLSRTRGEAPPEKTAKEAPKDDMCQAIEQVERHPAPRGRSDAVGVRSLNHSRPVHVPVPEEKPRTLRAVEPTQGRGERSLAPSEVLLRVGDTHRTGTGTGTGTGPVHSLALGYA